MYEINKFSEHLIKLCQQFVHQILGHLAVILYCQKSDQLKQPRSCLCSPHVTMITPNQNLPEGNMIQTWNFAHRHNLRGYCFLGSWLITDSSFCFRLEGRLGDKRMEVRQEIRWSQKINFGLATEDLLWFGHRRFTLVWLQT